MKLFLILNRTITLQMIKRIKNKELELFQKLLCNKIIWEVGHKELVLEVQVAQVVIHKTNTKIVSKHNHLDWAKVEMLSFKK